MAYRAYRTGRLYRLRGAPPRGEKRVANGGSERKGFEKGIAESYRQVLSHRG